jgi:hypothetical protein
VERTIIGGALFGVKSGLMIGNGDVSRRHHGAGCIFDLPFEDTDWILRLHKPADREQQQQTDVSHRVDEVV